MLSEKEKLDEELKLLEESFSLEVITKEEYDETKLRLEKKLNSLIETKSSKNLVQAEEKKIDVKSDNQSRNDTQVEDKYKSSDADKESEGQGKVEKKIGEDSDNVIESTAKININKKENIDINEQSNSEKTTISDETEPDLSEKSNISDGDSDAKIVPEKESDNNDSHVEIKKEDDEELDKIPDQVESVSKGISNKTYIYSAIAVIVIISSYFLFFPNSVEPMENIEILCNSDQDCIQSGAFGKCLNPGKEISSCNFIKDSSIDVTLLNARECFNCDKDRLVNIIQNYFPNSNIDEIQVSTDEGQDLAEKYKISSVPSFIFNGSIKSAKNYNSFSSAFIEMNESYIMKSSVANSNYYLARNEQKNKLDIIVKPGQEASESAQANLQEFLSAFSDVEFTKHLSSSEFAKELKVNTFPTFLVNNKVKFSGVHSAEKIKENFCAMNNLPRCNSELTSSLV